MIIKPGTRLQTIFYVVHEMEFSLDIGHRRSLRDMDEFGKQIIAEDCAEDYHSHHDGWEDSWPLEITLRDAEGGPTISKFLVEREAIPSFSASII